MVEWLNVQCQVDYLRLSYRACSAQVFLSASLVALVVLFCLSQLNSAPWILLYEVQSTNVWLQWKDVHLVKQTACKTVRFTLEYFIIQKNRTQTQEQVNKTRQNRIVLTL